MKKLYIFILLAISFIGCKECTTCEAVVTSVHPTTGEVETTDYFSYSQEEEGDCEIEKEAYELSHHEALQATIDYNNNLPTIVSFFPYEDYQAIWSYTLECD